MEAASGFEPLMEILQTSALTTWPRRRQLINLARIRGDGQL